jgi:hypothetical protein
LSKEQFKESTKWRVVPIDPTKMLTTTNAKVVSIPRRHLLISAWKENGNEEEYKCLLTMPMCGNL